MQLNDPIAIGLQQDLSLSQNMLHLILADHILDFQLLNRDILPRLRLTQPHLSEGSFSNNLDRDKIFGRQLLAVSSTDGRPVLEDILVILPA